MYIHMYIPGVCVCVCVCKILPYSWYCSLTSPNYKGADTAVFAVPRPHTNFQQQQSTHIVFSAKYTISQVQFMPLHTTEPINSTYCTRYIRVCVCVILFSVFLSCSFPNAWFFLSFPVLLHCALGAFLYFTSG